MDLNSSVDQESFLVTHNDQLSDTIDKGKLLILKAIQEKEQEYLDQYFLKNKNIAKIEDTLIDYRNKLEQLQNQILEQEQIIQKNDQYLRIADLQRDANNEFQYQVINSINNPQSYVDLNKLLQALKTNQVAIQQKIENQQFVLNLLQKLSGVFIEQKDDYFEITLEHKKQIQFRINFNDQSAKMNVTSIKPSQEVYHQIILEFNQTNDLNKLIKDIYIK